MSIHKLTKRDVFAFLIMLLAIVGQLPVALPFFAIATFVVLVSSVRLSLLGHGQGGPGSPNRVSAGPVHRAAVGESASSRLESVPERNPIRHNGGALR